MNLHDWRAADILLLIICCSVLQFGGGDTAVAVEPKARPLNLSCRLRMGRIDTASEMCTLVFKGNLPLLKRYLQAGIEVTHPAQTLPGDSASDLASSSAPRCTQTG